MIKFYLFSLLLLPLILLFPLFSNAQGIHFEQGDWSAVKAKAKSSNLPIFVDTYASWCEPCKWMNHNVFSKEEVGAFFNEHYISYKLDVEGEEGASFAAKYQVTAYPTLLYFNTEGELVHRIIGAFEAEDLLDKSKEALLPEHQIYTLQKKFKAGEKQPKFLKKYAHALMRVGENYQKVIDAYISEVSLEALIEEANFEFLEYYVNDYKHEAYLYVAANKADFILSLGIERVENYLDAAFKIRCYKLIENRSDKSTVRAFLQEVKQILPNRVDYFKTRMDFYAKKGNERQSYRLAKKYEKHCKDSQSLNAIARYMLDIYGKSKTHLETALEWVDRAILLDENIYTLETKAMILLALDQKQAALEVAQKQLILSQKSGEYLEETQALIVKIKG
ncbi:thioredoxin family protein [Aureispira anguillae]|uniref:Thioredoxin family protein n=1 Tax=Aureispira anguillae TaxID=2864201 RepID=A0A915YEK5_9BACT|nr:thioredoxin family protein [Aureispira anguillae]BDS11614.1 thioredoxin family protein [Aureispira anguillae]